MSGPAARTSRTTGSRPTAIRMSTPEYDHGRRRDPSAAVVTRQGQEFLGSDGAAAQPAAFTLRQTAPDAEALVVGEGVLQALRLDLAAGADLLRLAGRAALLGEERLGVGLGAEGLLLPRLRVGLRSDAQQAGDPLAQTLARALARAGSEPVSRPVVRTDVIAQPRHLRHDVASPLAFVPVLGSRDAPGPLSTRRHRGNYTRVVACPSTSPGVSDTPHQPHSYQAFVRSRPNPRHARRTVDNCLSGRMSFVQIVVLAGGTGGARFLRGVRSAVPGAEITAVVNTGDDVTLHGLRICPDLDTVMYTLGGGIDEERGWGRAGESWTVKDELTAYGADPDWFGLGDRDLATHLIRTRMLDAGYPLSAVTAALADRWKPGVTLLPMSDQRVETHVVVADAGTGRQRAIHFQEWWVRHRAALEPAAFVQIGVETARPAPGVAEAFAAADAVLLAPSNPVVSIGTILGVPGVRDSLLGSAGRVVGISPVIGGAVVRGMGGRCLPPPGVAGGAGGGGPPH